MLDRYLQLVNWKYVSLLLSHTLYFQCTEATCSSCMVPEEVDLPRYEMSSLKQPDMLLISVGLLYFVLLAIVDLLRSVLKILFNLLKNSSAIFQAPQSSVLVCLEAL